jgi:hypothetical protein
VKSPDFINYWSPTFRVMQKKSRPDIGRQNIMVEVALLAAWPFPF